MWYKMGKCCYHQLLSYSYTAMKKKKKIAQGLNTFKHLKLVLFDGIVKTSQVEIHGRK